jgi:hypothetical protein
MITILPDETFLRWFDALEERHLADLTFSEVRRGVEALSATWVEGRRTRLASALAGAGKRAAFALFYAPLHYLLIQAILEASGAATHRVGTILDLGCGTGVAGAAWALEAQGHPRVTGIEPNGWAAEEARWTSAASVSPAAPPASSSPSRPTSSKRPRERASGTT